MFSVTRGWFITEHGAPAVSPEAELKAFQWHPNGALVKPLLQLQSPITSCSTTTYKRSSCLFLEMHLLPSDRSQTTIIIAWKCWWYMAVNCMWMFSIKLKLLSTQVISIVEQLVHMKQHRLFCNIINALWQPPWSRWLQSSLTTLDCQAVSLPEQSNSDIILSTHFPALGNVSDRVEMTCCHIRAKVGYIDIFILVSTWLDGDKTTLIWSGSILPQKVWVKKLLLFCSIWWTCDVEH